MKVNEAPEKIYILKHSDYSDRRILNAFTEKESNNDIEYTRTDSFIEKACNYLTYHLDTSKIDVNYKFDFVEEFTKAMKGE